MRLPDCCSFSAWIQIAMHEFSLDSLFLFAFANKHLPTMQWQILLVAMHQANGYQLTQQKIKDCNLFGTSEIPANKPSFPHLRRQIVDAGFGLV